MYRIILFSCFFGFVKPLVAQQEPQFTHYHFNQLYVNPAAAGQGSVSQFQLIHRSQYSGYTATFDPGGSPTSQVITASVPVLDWRSGFGVMLVNDKIGPITMQDFRLSYALRMLVGGGVFAMGASAGIQRRGVDANQLRYEDDGDPLIPQNGNAQIKPDFGLGLTFSHPSFFFGLSSVHLTQPSFSFFTEAKNTLKRRYYANLGLNLPINYALDLRPMFILKTDLNNYSFEGGMMASINNKVMIGSSYRYQDAISAIVGFNIIKNMKLSYAGDLINFGLAAKAPSSHELMLNYTIPAIRIGKESIIRTPRYRY